MNVDVKRETHPFGYEYKEKHGGRFYYTSHTNFKLQWDTKISEVPEVFGADIPAALQSVLLPFFGADAMSVETETSKEPREEATARVLGRWHAIARLIEIREGRLVLKSTIAKRIQLEIDAINPAGAPLNDPEALSQFVSLLAAHRAVWKYALLDPAAMSRVGWFVGKANAQPDHKWKQLSYGTRSVLKLYAYDLLRDTSRSAEEIWPEWERAFQRLAAGTWIDVIHRLPFSIEAACHR